MLNIAAFLSYVFVANLSPGPNAVISLSYAGKYGLRTAVRFNLGIAAGVFVILLLCSLASLTVLRAFPAVRPVMVWAGAGYILWLAWSTLKSDPPSDGGEGGGQARNRNLFLHGALLQFINPNTILYGITVFSTFIIPYHDTLAALLLASVLLSAAAFLCTGCWTLFGSVFQGFVSRHARAVNRVMALLLVYCALSLIAGR